MAESLQVDKDAFEAALRALLNAKPTPMADIAKKREKKAKSKRSGKGIRR